MTKEHIYKTAIEVVVEGIEQNPDTSVIAVKNFLLNVLKQNQEA